MATMSGGRYFACEQPERPPEAGLTIFHEPGIDFPCRGCLRALEVFDRMYPGHVGKAWGRPKPIAEMLAEAQEAWA